MEEQKAAQLRRQTFSLFLQIVNPAAHFLHRESTLMRGEAANEAAAAGRQAQG